MLKGILTQTYHKGHNCLNWLGQLDLFSKGQTISEANYGILNSSKKQMLG